MNDQAVRKFVDETIASRKVVVFSKTHCPYCVRVKELLRSYSIAPSDYVEIELDRDHAKDCDAIQNYLAQKTGARTVPRVFIKGASVGGYDDTTALHAKGVLKDMLA